MFRECDVVGANRAGSHLEYNGRRRTSMGAEDRQLRMGWMGWSGAASFRWGEGGGKGALIWGGRLEWAGVEGRQFRCVSIDGPGCVLRKVLCVLE